jgi:hypothetical protein
MHAFFMSIIIGITLNNEFVVIFINSIISINFISLFKNWIILLIFNFVTYFVRTLLMIIELAYAFIISWIAFVEVIYRLSLVIL